MDGPLSTDQKVGGSSPSERARAPGQRHSTLTRGFKQEHQRLPLTSSWVLATSCGGVERWVLEDAGPVLDQLDAAVEGAVVDHLEGDVRVAVVDALCSRGAGDD